MRVFIDTNILISTFLNPQGTPAKAYCKAITPPNKGLISTDVTNELKAVTAKKFPDKMKLVDDYLSIAAHINLEVIEPKEKALPEENQIRDEKDKTILRAALQGKADIILTGDKDFLESVITNPRIVTAAEFLSEEFSFFGSLSNILG